MMRRGAELALGALLWGLSVNASPAGQVDKPLTLAAFPFEPPLALERIFAPMAAQLSEATGRRWTFRTAPDYVRFYKRLSERRYALVFVNALDYVREAAPLGYRPLMKVKAPLRSLLVVRRDASAESLDAMRGRRLGSPPARAAAPRVMRSVLTDRGLAVGASGIQWQRYATHSACLQAVVRGAAPGCVTTQAAYRLASSQQRARTRVLFRSAPWPNALFVARGQWLGERAQALRRGLERWMASAPGRRLRERLEVGGLVPASDADYTALRQRLD